MSLTPPKRLFHVPSMSTVIYGDVVDDIKEKGYAAVSHVWGNQKIYFATELGIIGGVDWEVPLSDPNKISKVVDAMNQFEMEYCWFDVLCMPQDKCRESEVNLEIPFMGDYYSGAGMTLVLSTIDYNISSDLKTLYDLVDSCTEQKRSPTEDEHIWIRSHESMIDFFRESWFRRVWTLQETVLSKNVVFICVDKSFLSLSNLFAKTTKLKAINETYDRNLFSGFWDRIASLSDVVSRDCAELDIRSVMNLSMHRNYTKEHDKFYGVLGILGYKDFVVDYGIDIEDVAKKMVQYAYSRGDVSWLAVGGTVWPGVVQPMREYLHVGNVWKEEALGACEIKFRDDALSITAAKVAKVTCCEVPDDTYVSGPDSVACIYHIFRKMGFNEAHATIGVTQFQEMTPSATEFLCAFLHNPENTDIGEMFMMHGLYYATGVNQLGGADEIDTPWQDKWLENYATYLGIIDSIDSHEITVVRATSEIGDIPLIVYGAAGEGDHIMLVRMCDSKNRTLGIITRGNIRRGVCLLPNLDTLEYDYVSRYLPPCRSYAPHEFLI